MGGWGSRGEQPLAAAPCVAGSVYRALLWPLGVRSYGPTLAGIGGAAGQPLTLAVKRFTSLHQGRQTPREGDIRNRLFLRESGWASLPSFGRPAVPFIARTTKRTPVQGSAIESGIPELTTGTCAEVGACIGGSRA